MFPLHECLMSLEIFQREFGYYVWDRDSMALVNQYWYKVCRSLAMADHCIQSVSLLAGAELCPEVCISSSLYQEPKNSSNLNHYAWQKVGKKKKKPPSHVQLFVIPRTIACQAPLSMDLSRQESWNGLPIPSPGESFQTGDWTLVSCTAGRIFTDWATREALDR